MFTHTLGRLGLAAILASLFVASQVSAAAVDDTTTFTGRWTCGDAPLAGARVVLEKRYAWGGGGTVSDVVDWQLFRQGTTNADGGFSLQVPLETNEDNQADFRVRALLDDGQGTIVRDFPTDAPVSDATGTNQNDTPVQNLHTLAFGSPACRVFLSFRSAYADYGRTVHKRPPYGNLLVDYNGDTEGEPWTDGTTVEWPADYPVGPAADQQARVLDEFAHTIRNAGLGGPDSVRDELAGVDYRLRSDPCAPTTPAVAFEDGWGEFWARDFAPAPACGSVAQSDQSVPGEVAWALTQLQQGCHHVSRAQMVPVLLTHGRDIHSLGDFIARLGLTSCAEIPLDPSTVGSYAIASPGSASRFGESMLTLAHTAERSAGTTASALAAARRVPRGTCPPAPCTKAIVSRIEPSVLAGALAQDRLLDRTVRSLAAGATQSGKAPSSAFVDTVARTPTTLTHGLAAIGAASLSKALDAAAPIAHMDRSATTGKLIAGLAALRHAEAQAAGGSGEATLASEDIFVQLGGVEPAFRTHVKLGQTVKQWLLTFGGLASGTIITNQVHGATFGSPQTIGFRGQIPGNHGCAAPPIAQHGGSALAPTCPSPDLSGYVTAGTLVRLAAPALTVSVRVGVTSDRPGSSIEASLNAFEANGDLGDADSAVVHSDATGLTTLTVKGTSKHPIAYVAIFSNGYWQQGPNLVFDSFHYTSD